MTTQGLPAVMPGQIDDFADRVACLQNLYKDLLNAHQCAPVFESQLAVVGKAISDLGEQAHLASLFGRATPAGRQNIMREARRIAGAARV